MHALRLRDLAEHFGDATTRFYSEREEPFAAFHRGPCLHFHVETISRLRALTGTEPAEYGEICRDKLYVQLLYATLTAWGMNSLRGGPKLQDFDAFYTALADCAFTRVLDSLRACRIEEVANIDSLRYKVLTAYQWLSEEQAVGNRVMRTSRGLVSAAKVLHHLLPDLLMPVDNTYTIPLLARLEESDLRPAKNRQDFEDYWKCIRVSHCLVRSAPRLRAEPSPDRPMDTSIPKIVDNAIVGMSVVFRDHSSRER